MFNILSFTHLLISGREEEQRSLSREGRIRGKRLGDLVSVRPLVRRASAGEVDAEVRFRQIHRAASVTALRDLFYEEA